MRAPRNNPARQRAGKETTAAIAELLREPYAREQHVAEMDVEALGRLLEDASEEFERTDVAQELGEITQSYIRCKDAYCRLLLALEAEGVATLPEEPLGALTDGEPAPDSGEFIDDAPTIIAATPSTPRPAEAREFVDDAPTMAAISMRPEPPEDDGEVTELRNVKSRRPPPAVAKRSETIDIGADEDDENEKTVARMSPLLEEIDDMPTAGFPLEDADGTSEGDGEPDAAIGELPPLAPPPEGAPDDIPWLETDAASIGTASEATGEAAPVPERVELAAPGESTEPEFVENALSDLTLPPMDVPPMDVPPMDVPPMDVPRMDVPRMDVPRMDVSPTDIPDVAAAAAGIAALESGAMPVSAAAPSLVAAEPTLPTGPKARELLVVVGYMQAMRDAVPPPLPAHQLNRILSQSLCFAVEVEGAEKLRPGLARLWADREGAIRSLLADGSGRFELDPSLRHALEELARSSSWMPDKRFPLAATLHSLRFVLASADLDSFTPALLDLGMLALFFGQDREMGRVALRNRMGIIGLDADDRLELALRLLRMQRLRNRALSVATIWDGKDDALLAEIETEAAGILKLLERMAIEPAGRDTNRKGRR